MSQILGIWLEIFPNFFFFFLLKSPQDCARGFSLVGLIGLLRAIGILGGDSMGKLPFFIIHDNTISLVSRKWQFPLTRSCIMMSLFQENIGFCSGGSEPAKKCDIVSFTYPPKHLEIIPKQRFPCLKPLLLVLKSFRCLPNCYRRFHYVAYPRR